MIIYCLILQSTTWMSSAWTDSLGHGCANDGLWHPCLFILSCLLPLSAYVRLCWQNDSCSSARSGEGSGFAKCLLFCKKRSFFLKLFSWRVSQPFPTNSCPGKATGALYCSLETRRRAGDGMKQQYLRPLLPLGTRHCSLTFCFQLGSDSVGLWKVTWHSCTAVPRFLTLWNEITSGHPTWWRSELHMRRSLWTCAGYAMLHMHELHVNYMLCKHTCTYNFFPMATF